MYAISRKDNLGRYLNAMRKAMGEEFGFYPMTWILPRDAGEFRVHAAANPEEIFIVKPEASSQGRGIFLAAGDEVPDKCVVQHYIHNPYLIDNLKFDLRLYVLVTGCDPLRVFLHE